MNKFQKFRRLFGGMLIKKIYKSKGLSEKQIQHYVREFRKRIGKEYDIYLPIVDIIELILHKIIPEFTLEILETDKLPNEYAETDILKKIIRVREDVYLDAIKNGQRSRFTLAHEIAHLLLHDEKTILQQPTGGKSSIKTYENPEWQANTFAGELLAPSYLIGSMSPEEIKSKCCISLEAATIQFEKAKKERKSKND